MGDFTDDYGPTDYAKGAADERARILAGVAALSTDWLHEDVIHFRDDVLRIVRNEQP